MSRVLVSRSLNTKQTAQSKMAGSAGLDVKSSPANPAHLNEDCQNSGPRT